MLAPAPGWAGILPVLTNPELDQRGEAEQIQMMNRSGRTQLESPRHMGTRERFRRLSAAVGSAAGSREGP